MDEELGCRADLTATLGLGHVQYLHQTAKEYTGRLDAWEHAFAVEDPRSRVNINRQLMKTTIRTLIAVRPKTSPLSEDSNPVQGPSTSVSEPSVCEQSLRSVLMHWNLVYDCIYCAQQEQSLTKISSTDLLEELDMIITEVFQSINRSRHLHWAAAFSLHKHKKSVTFSDVEHDNFVSLAAEAGLGLYVKHAIWRDECLAFKADRPLIHSAIPSRGSRRI